jgi:hypothetical protein
MKIAFDVKGTLDGPKGHIVLSALKHLQKMGHECIVWSNSYSYAVDFVKEHKLEGVRAEQKYDKWNTPPEHFYDFAIEDDRSQTYLAAKQFIFVHDIETTGWIINRMGLK